MTANEKVTMLTLTGDISDILDKIMALGAESKYMSVKQLDMIKACVSNIRMNLEDLDAME